MKAPVLLLVCVALAACQGSTDQLGVTTRDSAGVRIIEHPGDPWTAPVRWRTAEMPTLRIGAAEGDLPYLFDQIAGLALLEDGRLVVANGGDRTLRWFDVDGKFLFERGGEGEGPGEFSRLGELTTLPGDTIVAVDWTGRRFTLFGPHGGIGPASRINGLTAPPGRLYRLSTGDWIVGTSGASTSQLRGRMEPGRHALESPIFRLSSNGNIADTVGLFLSSEVQVTAHGDGFTFGMAPLGRRLSYSVVDDDVVVGTGEHLRFDVYTPSGQLIRSVRAPDVDLRVTPEIERSFRSRLQRRLDDVPAAHRASAEARLAMMELPELAPAYSELLTDARGNVWVGAYPFESALAQQFLVFEPEGEFLGRAMFPPSFDVMAIASDHVWGKVTDDLGVQYVVKYPLETGH